MRNAFLSSTVTILLLPAAGGTAPADASIHPGVRTVTDGAQCTANFVFASRSRTYIGQAAHCAGEGGATDTDGCATRSRRIGTPVQIEGASRPGRLAYSSWITMRRVGERDPDVCQYNDLALVRIDPADAAKIDPAIPFFGGPTAIDTRGTTPGEPVVSYGDSDLRAGLEALKPKRGVSLGDAGGGWSHTVLTLTPGLPGDSGSAFLDAHGRALGVLSTLDVLPLPATNGVSDLGRMVAYMRQHSSLRDVYLVTSRR